MASEATILVDFSYFVENKDTVVSQSLHPMSWIKWLIEFVGNINTKNNI